MGKSRSATLVVMFLMKKFMLPYKIASNLLKSRREKIDINTGFVDKLQKFEENGFKFDTAVQDDITESTEHSDIKEL